MGQTVETALHSRDVDSSDRDPILVSPDCGFFKQRDLGLEEKKLCGCSVPKYVAYIGSPEPAQAFALGFCPCGIPT